ncbi:MAG: hypothetical protein GC158_15135 [Cyanobacteria bacterium RI_101]|nr:hypothetical protein [Cyanobacteria bacterium RI_101]
MQYLVETLMTSADSLNLAPISRADATLSQNFTRPLTASPAPPKWSQRRFLGRLASESAVFPLR